MAKPGARPKRADQPVKMLDRGRKPLLPPRANATAPLVERPRYGADQPRRADRRAADHHARRAGQGEHGARVRRHSAQSPLTMTGIATALTTARAAAQSARPS